MQEPSSMHSSHLALPCSDELKTISELTQVFFDTPKPSLANDTHHHPYKKQHLQTQPPLQTEAAEGCEPALHYASFVAKQAR